MRNLNVFILLMFVTLISNAQEDTINLSAVTVSDYYAPKQLGQTARVVQVIKKDEIQKIPAQNVNDLLSQITTIDVRQRGVGEVQSDLSIRGGTYNQVLVLINGVVVNDPQTGHHNLDLPFSIDDIKRIEILEGPAGNMFGPYALNGAINVITEDPNQTDALNVKAIGGSFNTYNLSTSVKYHLGKSKQMLSVNKTGSDGYTDNTDYNVLHGFYQLFVPVSKNNHISLQAGMNDKKFGANSFYTPKYPNQYEKTKTHFTNIKFVGGNKLKYSPSASWRRHYDYYVLKKEDPSFYKNNHLTDVVEFDLPFHFTSNVGYTSFGTGIRYESIYSTALGNPISKEISIPNDTGHYNLGANRKNAFFFIDHHKNIDKFYFDLGLLINSFNLEKPEYFPSLNLAYNITKRLKVFGLMNKAMRFPTYTELYYPGLTNVGNPDLKPERATSFESGFKYNTEKFNGHISAFYRNSKDVIDWIRKSDTLMWESSNITSLIAFGLNISAHYQLNTTLFSKLKINSFFVKYQYIDNSMKDLTYISHYALEHLRQKANVGIEFNYNKLYWSITDEYINREGGFYKYNKATDKEDNILTKYKPYSLMNTKLLYTLKHYSVFIEIRNIFNEEYYDFGSILMPGTSIHIGISTNLTFNY